jgi:hypothetical protein
VISSVSVNPTSVTGGTGSTGTVALSAAAPTGGAVVTLTSGNTAAATVPVSVTVAAGATSATFPVTTSAVSTSTQVSLTGTYNGSQSTSLTVNPPVISSVSVNPTSVTGGTGSTGTVTLGSAAPTGGAVVTLTSSNTAAATVPVSVTVAADATSATFPITTLSVGTTTQVIITATYGVSQANTSISVLPGAPIILTQPSNTTTNVGQTATFSVVATGADPLLYQWLKNGGNIDGATSSTYTTPATVVGDDGATFDVVVTNALGSIESNSGTLNVVFPPQIQTQPSNQTVVVGETATFSVGAIGSPNLNYQWLKNGANIAGAMHSSYTTPPTVLADSGAQFSVIVSDPLGSQTSGAAVMTVIAAQSPATYFVDFDFGADSNSGVSKDSPWRYAPGMSGCSVNCDSINPQPGDRVIFKGGTTWDSSAFPMTVSWSGTSASPIYYGVDSTWFAGTTWTRPVFDLSGAVSFTAPILTSFESFITFDNIEIENERVDSANVWPPRGGITVEGGTSVTIQNCYIHGWGIKQPAAGSDANPFGGVAFYNNAKGGVVQDCVIDGGPASNSGTAIYGGATLQRNLIENVPNGIWIEDPAINLVINGNQLFAMTSSIDPTKSANAMFLSSSGSVYNNVIHDLASGATAINLQPPWDLSGTTEFLYDNLAWNVGPSPVISIGAGFGTTANYLIYNNTLISGLGSCVSVAPAPLVTLGLTVENNHCVSDQSSAPAWCWNGVGTNPKCGTVPSLTFFNNVLMSAQTAQSQGYTIQDSFQPTDSSNATVGAGLNLVTSCITVGSALCNDRIGVARASGTAAWNAGAYEFQVSGIVNLPPSITSQPASQTVELGQPATFNVIAAGTAPLTYQWTRNGTAIAGANSSSYTTSATVNVDNGSHFGVVVSNSVGSVSSSQAVLTVSAGAGQLTLNTNALNFGIVGVADIHPMSVTLSNTGNQPVHITGISVTGSGFTTNGVTAGLTIDPGQTATLIVVFTPVALGNSAGTVTVTSDAVNPNISVSLQGTGGHSVALSWSPGDSTPVFFYNVYRASVSGGPYVLLNPSPITTTQFVDSTVQSGQTYFYVITAVNRGMVESVFSGEVSATVPNP